MAESVLTVILEGAKTFKTETEIQQIIQKYNCSVLNVGKLEDYKLTILIDVNGEIDIDTEDWLSDWDTHIFCILRCFSEILSSGKIQFFLDYSSLDIEGYEVQPNRIFELQQEWILVREIKI